MKYEVTGISTPFGGVSWDKNMTGKEMFMHLFLFLESKRILINPIEMEKKEWCIESILDIKSNLVSITQGVSLNQFDIQILRTMIDSCNDYLDSVSRLNLPIIVFKDGENWENSEFDNAMKSFRNEFRDEIKKVEERYNLHFAKIIPEQY